MRKVLTLALVVTATACAKPHWSDAAVTGFVERAEMCAHWSGEEPYDDARRAEIDRALAQERCSTLLRDGAALKISRKDRPEDVRRIEEALSAF